MAGLVENQTRGGLSCSESFAIKIIYRPIDVAVVRDDQRGRVDRNWDLADAGQELIQFGSRISQRVGTTVNDYELVAVDVSRNSAAQEATVVGLVIQDVFESARDVCGVGSPRVVESSVWKDPEDEVRIAMGKIFDRGATSAKSLRQEREARSGF